MKLARIAVLVAVLGAAAAFVGVGLPEGAKGLSDQTAHGITVNGTGKVTTVPDRATFTFGVENRGKSASEASAANSRAMNKLIAALRDAGVPEADIQTVDVYVSPVYSDSGAGVIAYSASNSVSVTVSLERAGPVVDAAENAGADNVSGPNLTKADSDKLYDDALRAAVADARSRAQVLAEAAGVKVGAVISISESSASEPIPYATAMRAEASTPIQPGTQDVEATVTVTFAIA
jgi:uncharacterized protein YggE